MITRTRLGRRFSWTEREYLSLAEDAVEVDLVDGYEVERKRIFLNDIRLVSFHRARSRFWLWLSGVLGAIFLAIAVVAGANDGNPGAMIAFSCVFVLPFLIIFVFNALIPYSQVTIFGKRRRATMQWIMLSGKARLAFELLCSAVAASQEKQRLQIAEAQPIPSLGPEAIPGPATSSSAG